MEITAALEQLREEGEVLSERPVTDRERGETSRDGFGTADSDQPIKDMRAHPNLSEPAERDINPPTHPTRDDGLGEKSTGEPAGDRPVPAGDPKTEPGRTDVQ
jgi:hypothetical protein